MGTDVHAVWQAKRNGAWDDVSSEWEQNRHYFLFSWLADVRNGFGFAGVPTYTPIQPISKPRGYPKDFTVVDDRHPIKLEAYCGRRAEWMDDDEKESPEYWMGDHSHSWLTADEILSAPRPDKVWRTGVIAREIFDRWDGHSQPEGWCGDVAGKFVQVAESPTEVNDYSTHVRVWWIAPDDTLKYFVDEVKRLKAEHGEVRVVFGFDS